MLNFGDKLRQLRKEKNLTQKQLGELVGIRNSVISFYELGERVPSPEVVKKLAAVLHVSTDYLLGIEKTETVDISGLDENDKSIVRSLVDTLRNKNKIIK